MSKPHKALREAKDLAWEARGKSSASLRVLGSVIDRSHITVYRFFDRADERYHIRVGDVLAAIRSRRTGAHMFARALVESLQLEISKWSPADDK